MARSSFTWATTRRPTGTVRAVRQELVEKRWAEKGLAGTAEVAATAAAPAINDAATTRKFHPLTRTALDRILTVRSGPTAASTRLQARSGRRWKTTMHAGARGLVLADAAVGTAPEAIH